MLFKNMCFLNNLILIHIKITNLILIIDDTKKYNITN